MLNETVVFVAHEKEMATYVVRALKDAGIEAREITPSELPPDTLQSLIDRRAKLYVVTSVEQSVVAAMTLDQLFK